jgi:ribonuclease P protein component
MLPKQYRLRRAQDFVRVRRAGHSVYSQLAQLHVLPTRDNAIRVGFTVSKRVGKAVVRNRVKRRMREAVRLRLPLVRPGQDLVFVARAPAAEASFRQIEESVGYLLRKSRAIYPAGEAHNA